MKQVCVVKYFFFALKGVLVEFLRLRIFPLKFHARYLNIKFELVGTVFVAAFWIITELHKSHGLDMMSFRWRAMNRDGVGSREECVTDRILIVCTPECERSANSGLVVRVGPDYEGASLGTWCGFISATANIKHAQFVLRPFIRPSLI